MPGRATWPDRQKSFGPVEPSVPIARERLAAVEDDERHVDQRLDVVDDGRLAEQADLDRERRLVARLAALALDRLEERRLLAADVGAGAAPELDVEGEAGAEDVGAEEAGARARASIAWAIAGLGLGVLAADVEVALGRAGREGGDRHRLDDRERIALEQDAVLERAGLGFVGVADEVVRLGRLGRDGGPLAAGREGRAAAAHELRGGDLGDDRFRPDLERAGQGRVAAVGSVVVERGRVDDADAARSRRGRWRERLRGTSVAGSMATPRPRSVSRVAAPRRPRRPGASANVAASSPAIVNIAAGARSHSPRHGLRSHVARPSRIGSPAGPTARVRSAQTASAPASRQAMSSQTWATTGGRGFVANRA